MVLALLSHRVMLLQYTAPHLVGDQPFIAQLLCRSFDAELTRARKKSADLHTISYHANALHTSFC